MRRFIRSQTVSGAYATALEKLVPGLEKGLGAWLARLEAKVAVLEAGYGFASEETSDSPKKTRRPVETDLDAGRPSVILLGARLKSDRRFCRTLIGRAVSIVRGKPPAPRRGKKRRPVSRLSEYCQQ